MLWKRIFVADNMRAVVARRGRFVAILTPGDYLFITGPLGAVTVELFSLRSIEFVSAWGDFLVKERPDIVARHLVVVETADSEVAVVYVDGKVSAVVAPGKRAIYWRDAASIAAEVIDVNAAPLVPKAILGALERMGRESQAVFATVEDGRAGVLYLENRFVSVLEPGNYGFWTAAKARVEPVELRRQAVEIAGQEILTRDKVSIRVNITAEYQVVDAARAKQAVKDFAERLYRSLQLSIRQMLGRKTLEEILADKTDVDETLVVAVRAEMEEIGLRVGTIALKDIILPGEMREILNQVVAAEKQAQANLIRRREETAATRSLLNTAKLMEGNPILVRLKELETLEKLVEKVDRVSVAGGFGGMLENLLAMKDGG